MQKRVVPFGNSGTSESPEAMQGRRRLLGQGAGLVVVALFLTAMGAQAQTAAELQLSHLSSFEVTPEKRNPFWPVGWSPQKTADPASGVKMGVVKKVWFKEEAFSISSISTGGLPLAMINGKAYGEGELIAMPEGTVRVGGIHDGVVTLRFEDKTITVGIRREVPRATPALPSNSPGSSSGPGHGAPQQMPQR